jgi:DNA mismatch endonuclease Vsr
MAKWPGDAKTQQTTFGRLTRSELMARVRSRGNKTTENRVASFLRKEGIIGWRRHLPLPGNPDFAWHAAKVALFLDGCFWHGPHVETSLQKRILRFGVIKLQKTSYEIVKSQSDYEQTGGKSLEFGNAKSMRRICARG